MVTRHKYHIYFSKTARVEFIYPEVTSEKFSFVKYNELMGLIHPKFSFGYNSILIVCLVNFIMLQLNKNVY